MAHQHVILPDGPVLLVHKEWRHSSGNPAATTAAAVRGREGNAPDDDAVRLIPINRSSTRDVRVHSIKESKTAAHHQQSKPRNTRTFQFVNATGPSRHRDQDVRKLVRSHVMKGVGGYGRNSAREKRSKSDSSPSFAQSATPSLAREVDEEDIEMSAVSPRMPSICPGSATAFYGGASFEIKPRFYRLVTYFLSAMAESMYPLGSHLKSNPIRSVWFDRAITNEVLFHGILFTAAIRLSLSNADTSLQEDATSLMAFLLRQVNRRLESPDTVSEGSIAAVACLAIAENVHGHYDKWELHMRGLNEMVRIRGGLALIDRHLQLKVCRADIDGAVNCVSTPHLPRFKRSQPPLYTLMPAGEVMLPSDKLGEILTSSGLCPPLTRTFLETARLSHAINCAIDRGDTSIDPQSLDQDTLLLKRDFLGASDTDQSGITSACRMGALIYVKSLTRQMWSLLQTSKMLVQRLQTSLTGTSQEAAALPLLVWLFFMGGIASEQKTQERRWFTDNLVKVTSSLDRPSRWKCVRRFLKEVLWIDAIHDGPGEALWHETETLREAI